MGVCFAFFDLCTSSAHGARVVVNCNNRVWGPCLNMKWLLSIEDGCRISNSWTPQKILWLDLGCFLKGYFVGGILKITVRPNLDEVTKFMHGEIWIIPIGIPRAGIKIWIISYDATQVVITNPRAFWMLKFKEFSCYKVNDTKRKNFKWNWRIANATRANVCYKFSNSL